MRGTLRRWWRRLLPEVVFLARPHHWAEARQWLWFILLGGCLPFWGSTFVLRLFAQSQSINQLTGRGELALFSAGIFASAIPLMRRRVERDTIEHPEGLFIICVGLLVLSALVLSAVTMADHFAGLPRPDVSLLVITSITLFGTSLLVGFFVELTNNVRNDPDIMKFPQTRESELRARFVKELEGKNG